LNQYAFIASEYVCLAGRNCARLPGVRRHLRVPLRHEPEQTGTVDVVVLKELRAILFRVPVLFAFFDGRL